MSPSSQVSTLQLRHQVKGRQVQDSSPVLTPGTSLLTLRTLSIPREQGKSSGHSLAWINDRRQTPLPIWACFYLCQMKAMNYVGFFLLLLLSLFSLWENLFLKTTLYLLLREKIEKRWAAE